MAPNIFNPYLPTYLPTKCTHHVIIYGNFKKELRQSCVSTRLCITLSLSLSVSSFRSYLFSLSWRRRRRGGGDDGVLGVVVVVVFDVVVKFLVRFSPSVSTDNWSRVWAGRAWYPLSLDWRRAQERDGVREREKERERERERESILWDLTRQSMGNVINLFFGNFWLTTNTELGRAGHVIWTRLA